MYLDVLVINAFPLCLNGLRCKGYQYISKENRTKETYINKIYVFIYKYYHSTSILVTNARN